MCLRRRAPCRAEGPEDGCLGSPCRETGVSMAIAPARMGCRIRARVCDEAPSEGPAGGSQGKRRRLVRANLPRGQPPFFAPILPGFDKFLYREKAAQSGAIPSPQSRAHSPTMEGLALQCDVKRGGRRGHFRGLCEARKCQRGPPLHLKICDPAPDPGCTSYKGSALSQDF